jgi:hypothetical protein
MAMIEDDDETPRKHLQRQGIVLLIHHNIGTVHLAEADRALFWEGVCSLKQLPIRISSASAGGVHYCFNDFMIRQMVAMYSYHNWTATDEEEPSWAKLQYHDGKYRDQGDILRTGVAICFCRQSSLRVDILHLLLLSRITYGMPIQLTQTWNSSG